MPAMPAITITIYNGDSIRAENEIETADGPAVLVIEQDLPVSLPVTVCLQDPDGIERETIEYDGYNLAGEDGAEIQCAIIEMLDAIADLAPTENRRYRLSDGHESWLVTARDANAAVAASYDGNAGTALEVSRIDSDGDHEIVLYALVDEDGCDHRSWSPDRWGPVESEWIPVWQEQG